MIKSFRSFLQEKLILFNNGARYGQIVVMAGGAGSGKSYVTKNYMETEKFKIIDVDAWKESFVKLKAYPEWQSYNSKDQASVARLQLWILKQKIRDKVLNLLFDKSRNKSTLPNLLFDISLGSKKQLTEIVEMATETGYEPENIHLVYVLADWETALNRNRSRERNLDDGVVLKTLLAAAENVTKLIGEGLPDGFDGAIKVVDTNKKELDYVTIKKEGQSIDVDHWKWWLDVMVKKNLGGMPLKMEKK